LTDVPMYHTLTGFVAQRDLDLRMPSVPTQPMIRMFRRRSGGEV
jgi:hypothetical protein